MGAISECINLTMLDLSHNNVAIITGLGSLPNLLHLNLAYNRITQVDALKSCSALEHLHLQGNSINDTRTFETLADLKGLTNLYLQEFNGDSKNPVCNAVSYREDLFRIFSRLKSLDGTRRAYEPL